MPEDKKTIPQPVETLEEPEPAKAAPSVITPGAPTDNNSEPPSKRPLWQRRRDWSNIYLVVFLVLLAVAIAATVLALTWNNRGDQDKKKSPSLTSEELAEISGSTTIVGDPKQTLDIQSNTVLQGQLLVRKDLNVAGSIKVGGGLSLSSVTVGGQGNFGQLAINGTLSVSGDTSFSGTVNVQRNVSIGGSASVGGTLSAEQLNVTTLQLNGDLRINRHIIGSGALPGKSNGSALGNGGTASVNGSDTAGTVTINTGSSPPAGCFITVNFSRAYSSTPHVIISPSNSAAAGLNYYTNRSTATFSICTTNVPSASKTSLFDYIVFN